ncbi:hypothetical protein B0J11DRAFT_577649 [Dendryphion nanum]|uniref:Uncharacterized protein n=1 Tax=Dendryphion nanum TaxID=256645 RepID=A0A9P9IT67_9PLEO|nr:hypothetical protein B0J11DRAFT_577649 [Dendryphion nanum]
MDRLRRELKKDLPMKPCEVFDLIGGTSTSGLPNEPSIRATICEAALATSTATTFFDPVSIG